MSIRSMNLASVTMNQLQQKIDMVGHNMANLSTSGYKTRQSEFSSLLFQQINNLTDEQNAVGRITPDGIRVGTGARLGAITSNMQVGSIQETGRDLDVALLNPNQFFEVGIEENGQNEIRYTRDGSFYLEALDNGDMALVTKNGDPVMGQNGPIRFDATNVDAINITDNGEVFVKRGMTEMNVGQLNIVEIEHTRLLEAVSENEFRLPNLDALGYNFNDIVQDIVQNGRLLQSKAIEMSNVNISEEMTDLIGAQRAYQMNARTVTMADQMQGLVNQLR